MTAGHNERSASGAPGDPTEARLGNLSDALTRANIQSRELGVAQGLANQVPEDARAVLERTARTCPVHRSLHPDVELDLVFDWA